MSHETRTHHCVVSSLQSPVACLRSDVGFTLIELAVVAVVLALLVTMVAPRLARTAQRMRAEQAAFQLVSWLRAAHEQAVSLGRETVWQWDRAAGLARIVMAADAAATTDPETTGRLISPPLPAGIQVEVSRGGDAVDCLCVRFFPEGTSDPAALTMTLGSDVYTATVDGTTSQVVLRTGAPSSGT